MEHAAGWKVIIKVPQPNGTDESTFRGHLRQGGGARTIVAHVKFPVRRSLSRYQQRS